MSGLKNENNLFPVFLKMERLNTLIVGGGNVGLEKLEAILRNSPEASITLVGVNIKEHIKEMALEYPKLTLRERAFEPADLESINIAC